MIPIQILRVLSTIRRFDVPALLMGGQACVLYGAAEYSRDLDLRRLIDASYDTSRGFEATTAQIEFRPTLYHKMLGVQLSAHGKRVRSGVGRQS